MVYIYSSYSISLINLETDKIISFSDNYLDITLNIIENRTKLKINISNKYCKSNIIMYRVISNNKIYSFTGNLLQTSNSLEYGSTHEFDNKIDLVTIYILSNIVCTQKYYNIDIDGNFI